MHGKRHGKRKRKRRKEQCFFESLEETPASTEATAVGFLRNTLNDNSCRWTVGSFRYYRSTTRHNRLTLRTENPRRCCILQENLSLFLSLEMPRRPIMLN